MPVRIVIALTLLLAWLHMSPLGDSVDAGPGLDPAGTPHALPPSAMGPGLDPAGSPSPLPG